MARRPGAGWDELAALDPVWAILGDRGRGVDLDWFFAAGEAELAGVIETAGSLGAPESFGRALDFGCGLGRVVRALGQRFDECVGVDISERMVEQARELSADQPNCTFVVGDRLDSLESGSFDFVYSRLVLQHLSRPADALRTVEEFVRVARPGGLVVFQAPWHIPLRCRIQPRRRLWTALRAVGVPSQVLYARLRLHPVRLIAVSERDVRAAVARAGGRVVLVQPDDQAAPPARSSRYFVAPGRASASAARRASSSSTADGSSPRAASTT